MDDDRVRCLDCSRYNFDDYEQKVFGQTVTFRGRCFAAKPPMAQVPDVMHRCEYFNPKPDAQDQRKGIERWPELRDYPGGPARKPYPEKR
jgi:hypothetical protein